MWFAVRWSLLSLLPAGQCMSRFATAQSPSGIFDSTDGVLEVVQAAAPPRQSDIAPSCSNVLFVHSFANSYGSPYVGTYEPPAGCSFTSTIFKLSVTSQGRQYDRLALLYLGDVEVWRTSTAMPTEDGIYWSFEKDMTVYHSLLEKQQKIIFELNNVIDGDRYTGAFNVTLEAVYYDDTYTAEFTPADEIYAISNLSSSQNASSVFSLPEDTGAVNLTLPRNIKSAVVTLSASGNGAEEFWYTNVPSELTQTFPGNDGWLYGYSPFREVQLLIDGQLAGVSWPFPILFTGGVDPGAWRPIVGIDAFDLPTFEIDVTPWVSILCDGQAHVFQFQVVGYDSSAPGKIGPIGENWYVSGSLFVWLDGTTNQTAAGTVTSSIADIEFDLQPVIGTISTGNGTVTNTSLWFSLTAERSLSVASTIMTVNSSRTVSWHQELFFSNKQNMTDQAFNQSLSMVSSGSYAGSASGIVSRYTFPINLFSAYDVATSGATTNPGSVLCLVDRSLRSDGISLLPYMTGITIGSGSLATRQNLSSLYYWNTTIVEGIDAKDTSDGETWFSYSGQPGFLAGVIDYSIYLREQNDSMTKNESSFTTLVVPETVALPLVPGEPVI